MFAEPKYFTYSDGCHANLNLETGTMNEEEHEIKEAGEGQAQADIIILGLAQRRKRETFSIGYLWQSIANGVRKVKGHFMVTKLVDKKYSERMAICWT